MSEHHGSTKLTHKINHYSKHSHGKHISSTLRSLATNLFPRTPYHQFSNLFPSKTLSIQASYYPRAMYLCRSFLLVISLSRPNKQADLLPDVLPTDWIYLPLFILQRIPLRVYKAVVIHFQEVLTGIWDKTI